MTNKIQRLKDWNTWQELLNEAKQLRYQLHSAPELGFEEHQTATLIRASLDAVGIPWKAYAGTGTVATLNKDLIGSNIGYNQAAPHIALRGDIDALPINEQTKKDWRSNHPGKMHACGHDGHTAALIATALWLKRHESRLPGPVSFLFQPAEEGLHGAKAMIEDGALNSFDMIYGWHNWPAIPYGKAICPDGCVMAGNGTFRLTVHGKGGHSSQPQHCKNPTLVAAAIALELEKIIGRDLVGPSPKVLAVTYIDAPSGDTIIPETAHLGGSIRVANNEDRDLLFGYIKQHANRIAQQYDVEVEVITSPKYGATINHSANAAAMRQALQAALGDEWQDTEIATPIMASEDFSYYLQQIPGAFALVGANDGAHEHSVSCHSPHYDFNDDLIEVVVTTFCHMVGAPRPA